jgi:hypothetical protein
MITFIKSNKNSLVLQQILKMLPSWPNALSTTAENITVYSLEMVEISWSALIAHQKQIFFIMKREFVNKPGFSTLKHQLLWQFTSPRNENQASSETKLTVDQLRHCLQTEESNHKNVFLQLDDVSSKYELPLSYTVVVVTILWPFMPTLLKHSSRELTNFLWHFPADSY